MNVEDQLGYQSDLALPRSINEDEMDALFSAGCDDASPEIDSSSTTLHFDRTRPSLGRPSSARSSTSRAPA